MLKILAETSPAHLTAELSVLWYKDSIYTDSNETIADQAWG